MSVSVLDRLDSLRQNLARLGAAEPSAFLAAPRLQEERPVLAPLFTAGQAFGGLHEIIAATPSDLFTACGFALDFASACAAARPGAGLVLVIEDFVAWETGLPYGLGLWSASVDPGRVILVRTYSPKETLLAMETALRSRAVAGVLAESAIGPRQYDLAVSRRLLLAARTGGAAALLLPTALSGHAGKVSSAATARFEVARARSRAIPFGRSRVPIPGRQAFAFRLLKAPGGLTDAAARTREQWGTGVFGVPLPSSAFHAFSFDPSAIPADGPRSSPREDDAARRIA